MKRSSGAKELRDAASPTAHDPGIVFGSKLGARRCSSLKSSCNATLPYAMIESFSGELDLRIRKSPSPGCNSYSNLSFWQCCQRRLSLVPNNSDPCTFCRPGGSLTKTSSKPKCR